MTRETPEQRARREQRELMLRLNAARDAKLTTRQQNDMRMRGAPPAPKAAPTPQVRGRGMIQAAHENRLAQIDAVVDKATYGRRR